MLSRDPNIQVVGGAEVQQCILARLLAADGYRVSMICFDYGQPEPALVDGVTVHKSFRPDAGVPVLRFLHPRLTTMWRALREVDADVYYQRSSAMWTGVIAEFCRRYGKRSIYAGASDRDFEIGQEQIVHARDKWLYRRGLARVDRIVAQNAYQIDSCRRNHGREAVLIPSCYELPAADARPGSDDRVLWVGTIHGYKRPELLLDIAERLPAQRFVMIGGPSVGGERLKPGYFEGSATRAARCRTSSSPASCRSPQVEPWFDRARRARHHLGRTRACRTCSCRRGRAACPPSRQSMSAPRSTPSSRTRARAPRSVETLLSDSALWTQASRRLPRATSSATIPHSEVLARYARLFDELA